MHKSVDCSVVFVLRISLFQTSQNTNAKSIFHSSSDRSSFACSARDSKKQYATTQRGIALQSPECSASKPRMSFMALLLCMRTHDTSRPYTTWTVELGHAGAAAETGFKVRLGIPRWFPAPRKTGSSPLLVRWDPTWTDPVLPASVCRNFRNFWTQLPRTDDVSQRPLAGRASTTRYARNYWAAAPKLMHRCSLCCIVKMRRHDL